MKFLSVKLFVLFALCAFSISCSNVFTSVSDSEGDDALLVDAQTALNEKDYAKVITIIESMTADAQANREVRLLKASAHGGLCGVEFLSLLDSISKGGTDRFFITLMKTMNAASTTKQASCESAFDEIRRISTTAADRTDDENMLMVVIAMGTAGSILHLNGDTDDNDAVDGSFDHCTTISDADLNQLTASMAETFQSLTAVGSSTVANTDMSALSSACTDLAAQTPPLDFCTVTDPDAVSSDSRTGMKGLVGSDQSIGFGSCTGTVVSCALGC